MDHPTTLPSGVRLAESSGIRIVWSVPPHIVRRLPDRACDIAITQRFGESGDRQIGVFIRVDENEADLVVGGDFVVFIAA